MFVFINYSSFLQVDIPIHIVGGDVALITISGIGYDARKIGADTQTAIHTPEFSGVPKSRMIEMIGQVSRNKIKSMM